MTEQNVTDAPTIYPCGCVLTYKCPEAERLWAAVKAADLAFAYNPHDEAVEKQYVDARAAYKAHFRQEEAD